jgi:hypothetical protein
MPTVFEEDKMPNPVERRRLEFKPDKVKVLFVGESPPTNGTFFYNADSNLFRYTLQGFARVFGQDCGGGEEFLQFFKAHGCYLDDLFAEPLDGTKEVKQHERPIDHVAALGERMHAYMPESIVVVMLGIEGAVRRAQDQAGLSSVPRYALPFPANSWQNDYVERLTELLPQLLGPK